MPSLKDLRNRIRSVKSTQKITSAMKMVAAAKLRRAQEQAEAARPYAEYLERMVASLASRLASSPDTQRLLGGTGGADSHLIVVATSDRGLCGAFNSSIVRDARVLARSLIGDGKTVKILCIGRRGRDQLKRDFAKNIVDTIETGSKKKIPFTDADLIAKRVRTMFDAEEIDVVTIVFARFRSAISQIVTRRQLLPLEPPQLEQNVASSTGAVVYEYEPDEETVLKALLPRNLSAQIFRALLENNASENGARMTAMDNATRNAGEMIDELTLRSNRTRQAVITKELIEIISGAEAV